MAPPRSRLPALAHDVMDALATIRGRAQATRRRVEKVDSLSRDHIAADLHQIEDQADRLAALVRWATAAELNGAHADGGDFAERRPGTPGTIPPPPDPDAPLA